MVLLALLLIASPALADRTIEGRVTDVRGVDTIIVAGTAVGLNGVDGPETSTRYGREARAFMARLVQWETVTCDLNGEPCALDSGSSFDNETNRRGRDGYFLDGLARAPNELAEYWAKGYETEALGFVPVLAG